LISFSTSFISELICLSKTSFFALISFSAFAKTIEQKKDELQKIYEAGGISKIEHEKALKFLEKSTEDEKKKKKKKKQSFSLKNQSKDKDKDKNKKEEDKEEITQEKIDELGEIVSPSKTAEAVGKVEVQSNHVLERLDTIQTMLTLEVDARKKELEEKYQSENSQVFKDLEKMIIPLLKNLQKNPDKEYVVFCGLGGQGTLATKTMKDMGVKNVKNISGGIAEWDKIKDK